MSPECFSLCSIGSRVNPTPDFPFFQRGNSTHVPGESHFLTFSLSRFGNVGLLAVPTDFQKIVFAFLHLFLFLFLFFRFYFNRQPLPEGLFLLSTPNTLCHILAGRPLSHQVSPLNLYHNSSKCFSARSPGGYLLRTSQDPCCVMGSR